MRQEFIDLIEQKQITTYVNLIRSRRGPSFWGDNLPEADRPAHFAVTLSSRGQVHKFEYSAGIANALREYREGRLKVRGLGRDADLLATDYQGNPHSLARTAAVALVREAYRPTAVDVIAAVVSDSDGWEPDMTFREFMDEGTCEGLDPADALDVYEAVKESARFCARVFGGDLERAQEIAREL